MRFKIKLLIAGAVVLIVLGLLAVGRALGPRYQAVTDAARDAARVAASGDPTLTPDMVIARMNAALAAAGVDTTTATATLRVRSRTNGGDVWPGSRGDTVIVDIAVPTRIGLWPQTLRTRTKFRHEGTAR